MPAGTPLRALLDATDRRGPLILTNTLGRPWTSDGFRTSWAKACDRAGVSGLTFHDLRGTAVVRLAIAGATVPQIAAVTGPLVEGRRGHSRRALLGSRYSARRSCGAEARSENKTVKMTCKTRPSYRVTPDAKCLKSLVGAPGLEPGTR